MKRNPNDPRIANVLARFDDWRGCAANMPHHAGANAEVGRYMESLLTGLDWSTVPVKLQRRLLVTLLEGLNDEWLDILDRDAREEHRIFLECAIGSEIAEDIQRAGLNPADAESEMHHQVKVALEEMEAA